MDLVFFLLACVGLTHIIIDGSIMQWFRNLVMRFSDKLGWQWPKDLISCYMCTSVWVGFILGLLMQPAGDKLILPVQIFVCGCASSYFTVLATSLLNFFDRPWPTTKE